MATEKKNTSIQKRRTYQGLRELDAAMRQVSTTLKGIERVDAIVEGVQRYAIERTNERDGRPIDTEFADLSDGLQFDIESTIRDTAIRYVSMFISGEHREFMVRGHARGLSTGEAVTELINRDDVMKRLSWDDAVGWKGLRDFLIHRLSYLKPGTTRWPEKKYGAVWRETRERYKQEISDFPLTSHVEQFKLLALNADRLDRLLQNTGDAKRVKMLTSALTQTISSLNKLTAVEPWTTPVNLSEPQFVAVLERLTIVLKAPEQVEFIDGKTKELVESLVERLTLESSDRPKAFPAETGVDKSKAKE